MTPPATTTQSDSASDGAQHPALVIDHRVRSADRERYEAWLQEIMAAAARFPGHQGVHVGPHHTPAHSHYAIAVRFRTVSDLEGWHRSTERRDLVEAVAPLLVDGDETRVETGLEFWFPSRHGAPVISRRRQWLVTWSALVPLVAGVSAGLRPLLEPLGPTPAAWTATFAVPGIVVALMVWFVMPRWARLWSRILD